MAPPNRRGRPPAGSPGQSTLRAKPRPRCATPSELHKHGLSCSGPKETNRRSQTAPISCCFTAAFPVMNAVVTLRCQSPPRGPAGKTIALTSTRRKAFLPPQRSHARLERGRAGVGGRFDTIRSACLYFSFETACPCTRKSELAKSLSTVVS